jgi:hypothetical protein
MIFRGIDLSRACCVPAIVGLVLAAPLSELRAGTWSYAGTNPDATNQSTTSGKMLVALQGWNGKLYSGFGDWTSNTGPIQLNEFNPTNHAFTPRLLVTTEAIQNFRIVNGRLLIPWIDPKSGEANGGMGVGDSGRAWKQPNNLLMVHCFDVVTYTGTDLWLVGSGNATTNGPEGAKAYRSFDNGATWTDVKSDNAGGGYWDRFYWLGVLNGKLYIQNSESAPSSSLVFDGTTWTNGPNISDYAMHAEVFMGKFLLTTSYPLRKPLHQQRCAQDRPVRSR